MAQCSVIVAVLAGVIAPAIKQDLGADAATIGLISTISMLMMTAFNFGGGVSAPTDPIDVTEFSEEEIRAAVSCAADWGTYVMVHGYTDRAVNRAIVAGVQCIEHGQLLSKKTLQRMAKEGVWLNSSRSPGAAS